MKLYEDAVQVCPGAQSAYFALGLALLHDGRATEGRQALVKSVGSQERPVAKDTLLTSPDPQPAVCGQVSGEDPWWGYLFDSAEDVARALDSLRDEVRQ